MLSKLFGVTTDYLLKDDISEELYNSTDDTLEGIRRVTIDEANEFMELKKKNGPKVALGTALCILSPIVLLVLAGYADCYKSISEDMACGIGVIVLLLFVMMIIEANDFWCIAAVAMLLCIIAVAVSQFIIIGEIKGSYDQLLQEGDYTATNKKSENLVGKIGSIYWPIMIAIYLGYSFITMKWEISWVIWPVAGILFGAIAGICKIVKE